MTLSLAQAMGLTDAELVHVRRGALLHDIGKMGVPDAILHKPGPLTDEEWIVMRKHPVYAYDLLSPIDYLRPALDIPYYHHEKWDGTGYPRGLVGEQIPFAARLFAVVDVADALLSDRPYRAGWTAERVRRHIASLSGSHFEPPVVAAFMQLGEPAALAARLFVDFLSSRLPDQGGNSRARSASMSAIMNGSGNTAEAPSPAPPVAPVFAIPRGYRVDRLTRLPAGAQADGGSSIAPRQRNRGCLLCRSPMWFTGDKERVGRGG